MNTDARARLSDSTRECYRCKKYVVVTGLKVTKIKTMKNKRMKGTTDRQISRKFSLKTVIATIKFSPKGGVKKPISMENNPSVR